MDPIKKTSIYYDDACRLCSSIIETLGHSSQSERIEPVRITDRLPHGVTTSEARQDVHAVDANGVIYKGADAVLFIVSLYPRWRWLAAIGRLPGIRQMHGLIYRVIADNRQWLQKK